ncbi:MAG TPA: gliding motility-associated C-terminal domain-containing protein, partial [Phaeodactylibacter sp.]|nr:gliding motility-associated C-terminal domain-containing protein [Phaeodactylibacter sp.]
MAKRILKNTLLFLSFFFSCYTLMATHNRAGEITYRQIGPLTIEATITTYTKTSSTQADRDTLTLCWGDGTCDQVARLNGNGQELANDVKRNLYVAIHTYPSQGHFTMSMNDPNRNQGICNVNPNGQSDQIPFHIETTVTLLNESIQGANSSPVLLQPPIDIGCVGQPFTHDPNAYDEDNDSLSFHLITPLQDVGTEVLNYQLPSQINAGPNNTLSLDPVTGIFTWTSPQLACEYNIAFYIVSYRDGIPLDTIIRDMQILILECDNEPPLIETIEEICVVAGEVVEFDVVATAPLTDTGQMVNLTALGGPFEQAISPATFDNAFTFQNQPLTRTFHWQTQCEHISAQYYNVVFRSNDNFPLIIGNDTSYLSTLKKVRIKVVGPPPLDVLALAGSGQVEVSWENPYICETAEDYFQGFTLWRKQGSNQFQIDTCITGLAGRGYIKLTDIPIQEIVDGRYYYLDTDVERGRTYCYRILAEFAQQTAFNPPSLYNKVESLPSEEFCVQLSRDIPLITNVDVLSTDTDNGSIKVIWTKPLAEDLDTLLNPGPYTYEVYRATGFTSGNFQPTGVSFTSQWFATANDTTFVDTNLDTENNAYSYEIAFYVNGESIPLGTTNGASSPRLSVASTDETNILSWVADVPWENYLHHVFIFNNNTSTWDSLTTTTAPTYAHTGLVNGLEYCYRVQTVGSYGIEGINDSLLNFSQRICGIPLDTIPPCPPILEVFDDCENATAAFTEEDFVNDLIWQNPNFICPETDDVVGYNIYYAPFEGTDFELIETFANSTDTTMNHKPE